MSEENLSLSVSLRVAERTEKAETFMALCQNKTYVKTQKKTNSCAH